MFEEGSTRILMDPLLEDTFGLSDYGIEIVPPRIVEKSYTVMLMQFYFLMKTLIIFILLRLHFCLRVSQLMSEN